MAHLRPNPTPVLRKRLRRSSFLALILVVVGSLSGCDQRWGMPHSASDQGKDVFRLWEVSFYIAVVLGFLVLALICYSLIRHRRKNDELPRQTEGNVALEITYTVIPFIIVSLLFAYGLKVQAVTTKLTSSTPPPVHVDVTGYQWNWRFEYRNPQNVSAAPLATVIGGIQETGDSGDTLPLMVLPVNERVRFNLVAADVAHSFFVPGFLTKRDLIPGVRNQIEITPDKTGFYMGHCAEYCGVNHSQMNFRVKVVSQNEYRQWLASQPKSSPTPPPPSAQRASSDVSQTPANSGASS